MCRLRPKIIGTGLISKESPTSSSANPLTSVGGFVLDVGVLECTAALCSLLVASFDLTATGGQCQRSVVWCQAKM